MTNKRISTNNVVTTTSVDGKKEVISSEPAKNSVKDIDDFNTYLINKYELIIKDVTYSVAK